MDLIECHKWDPQKDKAILLNVADLVNDLWTIAMSHLLCFADGNAWLAAYVTAVEDMETLLN